MGLNSRWSDRHSPLAEEVTRKRDEREAADRDRVRRGEMSLDAYLTNVKGYRREHLNRVRSRFHRAIFGAA